jgi:hypothetical protein
MRKLIFLLGLIFITGCVPVLIGTGVVGGYLLSNDSAIGKIKIGYSQLWDVCIEKLEEMEAEITQTDESKGIIRAKILENFITIKIDSLTPKTQRLKVSVRKYLLPQPQFAQKVFFEIAKDVEEIEW